jgi:hypothetical protein
MYLETRVILGKRVMPGIIIFLTMSLALLSSSEAIAANRDVSICLNGATKLEAGILVSDDNLLAAHIACERAKEGVTDGITLMKLVVASGVIDDEHRRRAASHY